MNAAPLLEVSGLTRHFPVSVGLFGQDRGRVRAVDGVSFAVNRGETLGLVGESGSGKSTLARTALRLIDPTAGRIHFEGRDITRSTQRELRPLRRQMQMVFQDPYASLDPRMTVEQIIGEAFAIHRLARGSERSARVEHMLAKVGLPAESMRRYPHEFSGGERQRIGIARALAVQPSLVLADEPISALDVSIQAQIINLLMDLQRDLQLTYLFIAHDLRVVEFVSDRVAVMYLGRIVEIATRDELYRAPRHPYTQMLFSAMLAGPRSAKTTSSAAQAESAATGTPAGCAFHPRCRFATDECRRSTPPLFDLGAGHAAACFLVRGEITGANGTPTESRAGST